MFARAGKVSTQTSGATTSVFPACYRVTMMYCPRSVTAFIPPAFQTRAISVPMDGPQGIPAATRYRSVLSKGALRMVPQAPWPHGCLPRGGILVGTARAATCLEVWYLDKQTCSESKERNCKVWQACSSTCTRMLGAADGQEAPLPSWLTQNLS